MFDRIKIFWCNATHGGGHVKRDPQGQINWQCSRCGRWGIPVSHEDAKNLVERDLRDALARSDDKQ